MPENMCDAKFPDVVALRANCNHTMDIERGSIENQMMQEVDGADLQSHLLSSPHFNY